MLRPLAVGAALALAALILSACGTKGDLECPRGTQPHVDGTCRPPPPAPPGG
jgi:predicted small lipoprotein YifL